MKPVYIVDGIRTPFLKARGVPGPFSAADLAVYAGRQLLNRLPISPTQIGETVIGCMMPSENEANIGRLIGLRLGCGKKVPGWTVQRNCASGMQALDSAMKDIQLGRYDLVLAGGTEAMSRAPLLFQPSMAIWLAKLQAAKSLPAKLKVFTQLKPSYLKPIIALIHGLSDPFCGVNMGQTAEILAYQFGISREEMDDFALRSQQLAAAFQASGQDQLEITPIFDAKGIAYTQDDGVRADSSLERLAKLKPFFDKKFGLVTAGNSSQITDGAALLLLASEEAVVRHQLPVLGKIVDVEWAGLSPEVMGLGPVMASVPLLQRQKMTMNEIDCWEINEAFAGQVLACLKAFECQTFCQTHFGLEAPLGKLELSRLNMQGGAIALGHPVGATGARLVLHVLRALEQKQARYGMASLCIGGGQGGAMLIERVKGV